MNKTDKKKTILNLNQKLEEYIKQVLNENRKKEVMIIRQKRQILNHFLFASLEKGEQNASLQKVGMRMQ